MSALGNKGLSLGHRLGYAAISCALAGGVAQSAQAQSPALEEMQRNIDIFSGVLREGLDLNARAGIFSPLNGSVRGTYFREQGIVLEIISPLSNTRTSFSWQTLEDSLRQLSGQLSSFAESQMPRISPPDLDAMRDTMALSLRAESAQGMYAQVLESLRDVDVSGAVESALAQAGESARKVHQLGQVDDARLNRLMEELSTLRASLSERVQALSALRTEATAVPQADDAATSAKVDQLRSQLEQVRDGMSGLQAQAVTLAEEWRSRAEEARSAREAQWASELASFETSLYELTCRYAAAVRELPEGEHLTLVLKGLGEEQNARYADRIHVLRKADIEQCQQGALTAAQLQERGAPYSF